MSCIARCLLGLGIALGFASGAHAQNTFVQAGRLLADPANGQVLEQRTIVIADGRVTEIRNGWVDGPGTVIDCETASSCRV